MKTNNISAVLVLGIVLISTLFAVPTAQADQTWLATGTITKIDGSTFYLLGKNNVVYTINAGQSEVIVDNFRLDCYTVRVGDTVRVFGCVDDPKIISAKRVRILKRCGPTATTEEPKKEIKVIMQGSQPEPATEGNGPEVALAPQQCDRNSWEGRGLINDIDYSGYRIKVQTSAGQFSINTGSAFLTNGGRKIGFGRLNLGDAVRITGRLVGCNEIDAAQVCVMRTRSEAENALPQMPVSVAGVIQQIDYPSMTFKMRTASSTLVVAADANTVVQQQMDREAFMNLKPGMRVKMSGYGSLGTGFTAQHIQIISVAP